MAFTAVPLHNLSFPAEAIVPFGKFTFQEVPDWLLKKPILQDLSWHDRDSVAHARALPGTQSILLWFGCAPGVTKDGEPPPVAKTNP